MSSVWFAIEAVGLAGLMLAAAIAGVRGPF